MGFRIEKSRTAGSKHENHDLYAMVLLGGRAYL
jgi:hypothetical protein